jgi:hypothetical protein
MVVLPTVTADAKQLSAKAARGTAYNAVAAIGRKTHASSTKVLGCRRSTSVRYFCQVQNTFRTGASRCVADVVVRLNTRSGRARAEVSEYVCY